MTTATGKIIRPDAGCMRCGRAYTGSVERTVMCAFLNTTTGLPCGGRITWRANAEDWTECPDCRGTGLTEKNPCPRCLGDGWLMGRHH